MYDTRLARCQPSAVVLREPTRLSKTAKSDNTIEMTTSNVTDHDDDEFDTMSVRTEDFEAVFAGTLQPLQQRQLRGDESPRLETGTTFDQFFNDNDLDSVKSQSVRETFQMIISRPGQ